MRNFWTSDGRGFEAAMAFKSSLIMKISGPNYMNALIFLEL